MCPYPLAATRGGLGQGGAAFDYYVDSVNGNNANSGRSPSQAFATIGALPTLTAGIRIGLAKGSHWREQLTATLAITIGAYGSGSNPIIDGSNIVSGWSKTAGKTNIYQATVTAILSSSGWINAWENDAFMTRAASLVALDSAPGSYFVSADTGSGSTAVTFYVYATGGGDPTVNGKTYECGARQCAISGANDVTLSGITTRRQIGLAGGVAVVKRARFSNCRFEDGNIHNCYHGGDSVLTDCVAENSYYGGTNATLFVCYETVASGTAVTYTRCEARNTRGTSNVYGYLGHDNGGGANFGLVVFDTCSAYSCLSGFNGFASNITRCLSCTADTCGDGFSSSAATQVEYTNCTATNCTASGFYSLFAGPLVIETNCLSDGCLVGYKMDSTGTTNIINCRHKKLTGLSNALKVNLAATVVANGLVACVNTSSQGCFQVSGDGSNVTLTNCVATSVGVGASNRAGLGLQNFAHNITLTISGCTFDGFQQAYSWGASPIVTLSSDNNDFDPNTQDFIISNVTYADLAAYVAATGKDSHSTGNAVDTAYACV